MSLTEQELERYLGHIEYPRSQHAANQLEMLSELIAHQICRVPFESLTLHYSPHHTLGVELDSLFQKVVVEGKGGYCTELNAIFAAVLRGLGFKVLSVGARVCVNGRYSGWTHMLNIVTIEGTKYAVDVGFGSFEAMRPVPLESGFEFTQVSPRRGKLEYRALAQNSDPDQRLWVFSTQEDPSAAWDERICFAEIEYFPVDYNVMNYYSSTNRRSFFVKTVMVMRGILDEDSKRVGGILTLFQDEVKRKMADKDSEVLEKLGTEQDRVNALDKYFRVSLTPAERRGIEGLSSALRS